MNAKALIIILVLASSTAMGQKATYKGFPSVVWPKLYTIAYKEHEVDGVSIEKPIFSNEVKKLAGKKITLPGYLVPFTEGRKSKKFMLSSLPLNACFFCGVGGPETVAEIHSINEVTYTDRPIEISGTLRLNDSNPEQMIYILENAQVLGEIDF
jgi:hypothetical protein